MAVTFDSNDYIRFTAPTASLGHTSKTYHFQVASRGDLSRNFYSNSGSTGDYIATQIVSTNRTIQFEADFSTTNGVWTTTFSLGTGSRITITYNGGSTANNPIIYVNGVSQTVTRTTAPVGTYQVPANRIDLGYLSMVSDAVNLEDFRIYNVIKTAAQVAAIASEDIRTDQNIDESGLVFHAPLTMCKGLTYPTYVGTTLGTANEFLDRINGYVGVPSGSPVGA